MWRGGDFFTVIIIPTKVILTALASFLARCKYLQYRNMQNRVAMTMTKKAPNAMPMISVTEYV